MGFFFFYGYRPFASEEDIRRAVRHQHNFIVESVAERLDGNAEKAPTIELDNVRALKFFQTSKQQSWLVVAGGRVYCCLDDIEKSPVPGIGLIRWSARIEEVKGNVVTSEKSAFKKYGVVEFGQLHKNWFYSKDLFPSAEMAKAAIEEFLANRT